MASAGSLGLSMNRIRRDREHHTYVTPQVDEIEEYDEEMNGERALWLAVLGRQIRDAFGTSRGLKRKAIAWLFSDTHKENRNKVCDMANIYWDCWSGEIKGFIQGMKHCDYVLVDGRKMNGREIGKYICKMLARAAND